MDFSDKIQELSARIPKQLDYVNTEEATKNALIMPFISALGYDVFDPSEVTPELIADVGVKKGEKVDYAILKEGKPIMIFECKHHAQDLNKAHASQLYRYFSVTHARFAILTNGLIYRFFTDLEAQNKMDSKHFFEFDILDYTEREINELKKFTKFSYDLEEILNTASELKYTRAIKQLLAQELQDPSDDFIRVFASQVYSGKLTKSVKDDFAEIIKKAASQFINERINQRLESALAKEQGSTIPAESTHVQDEATPDEAGLEDESPKIVTTEEEREAYYIVKSILRKVVDPDRIVMRDVQSYCGILLDDNNRQPICRLRFNSSQKYIGLILDKDKTEDKVPIDNLNEIFNCSDQLRKAVSFYG